MELIFDTHAHYDDEAFDADRDALLAAMPEQGVGLSVHTEIDYRRPALLNECIAAECRFIEDGRKPRLQVVITNPSGECVAEVTGLFVRTKKQLS